MVNDWILGKQAIKLEALFVLDMAKNITGREVEFTEVKPVVLR